MLTIKHILCPIDFSEASRHALAHAIAIAKWYEARITGLHVSYPSIVVNPPILLAEGSHDWLDARATGPELQEQLDEWLVAARRVGVLTDAMVDAGNPAVRILSVAASFHASLIVMGTHGRSGFERLLLGSVAEKVLRRAQCPVMTVPPPAVSTSKLPFAHLLCPVDFSDSSLRALEFAFSMAEESNARLTLMHVFEWPSDEASARRVLETSEYHRVWEAETKQKLKALIPDEVRNWCTPEPVLAFGKAYQEILRAATAENVDLIEKVIADVCAALSDMAQAA